MMKVGVGQSAWDASVLGRERERRKYLAGCVVVLTSHSLNIGRQIVRWIIDKSFVEIEVR